MTATLMPPVTAVARSNPADRLRDYLDALGFYLSLPDDVIDRILFVDNSGSDLAPIGQLVESRRHGKEVELVSFSGNEHSPHLGKAYGEFKLMDFGLARTTLFTPDDLVWKTTGRLQFLNLAQMSSCTRALDFDVLCDLHNVPFVGSGTWSRRCSMDLRLFAFRPRAYDLILRDLWRREEGSLNDEFMYFHMREKRQDIRVVPRFPVQAQLRGISGRHQRDYLSGSQRAKDVLRSVFRRTAPWLWL